MLGEREVLATGSSENKVFVHWQQQAARRTRAQAGGGGGGSSASSSSSSSSSSTATFTLEGLCVMVFGEDGKVRGREALRWWRRQTKREGEKRRRASDGGCLGGLSWCLLILFSVTSMRTGFPSPGLPDCPDRV
jgi:hypothetical protein